MFVCISIGPHVVCKLDTHLSQYCTVLNSVWSYCGWSHDFVGDDIFIQEVEVLCFEDIKVHSSRVGLELYVVSCKREGY